MDLPIKEDATPVGASNKHFGFVGSSPCLLRMYSTHALKTFIKKDLPTPPPPEIKKISDEISCNDKTEALKYLSL